MTRPVSDLLYTLAPPMGIIRFVESEIEKRKAAGKEVTYQTLVWLQTWRRIKQGLKVEEVDILQPGEWDEIEMVLDDVGAFVQGE